MFSIGISKLNFRIAAFAGALSIFGLGCGRQDKKDIGAIQTVPYAEAMKKCPDKVRPALILTENFSTNRYVPLMIPVIKITNGDLLFTEDALCVPVKQEPKVAPTVSASASALAPLASVSAPALPSVSAPVPSSTVKVPPSTTGPIRTVPTSTTGGFRPK